MQENYKIENKRKWGSLDQLLIFENYLILVPTGILMTKSMN